jgi:hypothetical protein
MLLTLDKTYAVIEPGLASEPRRTITMYRDGLLLWVDDGVPTYVSRILRMPSCFLDPWPCMGQTLITADE